jgi:N-acetylmuramoyl-L-alanine amidase
MVTSYLAGKEKVIWLYSLCHGVDTPGKRGPKFKDNLNKEFQIIEWMYGRDIIFRLIDLNIETGTNFIVINPENKDISVQEKVERINKIVDKYKDEYTIVGISLHGNAANIDTANGIEIFTSKGETKSDKIADIFGNFYFNLDMNFRKDFSDGDLDKEESFYELKHTKCPWILPEIGFYTNRNDALKMNDPNFRDKVTKLTWSAQRRVEEKIKLNLL